MQGGAKRKELIFYSSTTISRRRTGHVLWFGENFQSFSRLASVGTVQGVEREITHSAGNYSKTGYDVIVQTRKTITKKTELTIKVAKNYDDGNGVNLYHRQTITVVTELAIDVANNTRTVVKTEITPG